MNEIAARRLVELNNAFYRRAAASFNSTRHNSWPGWERVAAQTRGVLTAGECRVLDVACGNLRFEAWLARRFPQTRFSVEAVDSCAPLAGLGASTLADNCEASFTELDVLAEVAGGAHCLHGALGEGASDLAVCFGFFHHIPLAQWRFDLLDALVDATVPGGCIAVSLWCFMHDAGLAARARSSTLEAQRELGSMDLDEGDYLLGWQGERGAWRYCHSFSEDEAMQLAKHVEGRARLAARYASDGRSGNLNEYLLFECLGI